jgi:hypothetical protein
LNSIKGKYWPQWDPGIVLFENVDEGMTGQFRYTLCYVKGKKELFKKIKRNLEF